MPLRLVLLCFLFPLFLQAQGENPVTDTLTISDDVPIVQEKDTPEKTTPDSIPWPNPKIAWKLSAALPGAGQVYNKCIWKVPIIYAGLGVFSYLILDNHAQYKTYHVSYLAKAKEDSGREDLYPELSIHAVQQQRNYHRQNRDLLFLLGGVWYALNIVEAFVDAHLKHFDVSESIALRIYPAPVFTGNTQSSMALGIKAGIRF